MVHLTERRAWRTRRVHTAEYRGKPDFFVILCLECIQYEYTHTHPFCYSHTETTIHTENNHSTTTFQCVFICSPQLERLCISCQQYLAIDGTFLKCFYVQTLLLSVTVGANDLYLLLEWAFVESKNTNVWEYYVRHLHYFVLQILTSTIMSGLEKEMLSVEDFPGRNVT
jgi:hypothetical protein